MKLNKEAEVWIKEEKLRIKSCWERIDSLERQSEFMRKSIDLEHEQINLIEEGIQSYLEDWEKA